MAEINNSGTGQWSETDASNTSASPNGWAAGTYFNQVEPIGQATMGAIKRFWDRINGTVTTTGSSGTYLYASANTSYPTAYVQGETYSFKAHQASAGNDTFQINSLSAINMYQATGTGVGQVAAGAIQTGQHIVGQIDTSLNSGAGGLLIVAGLASVSLNSPAFTGTPTAPTASAGTSTTQLATTAFVNSTALTLATGTTAVTQSALNNSTDVATTAYTDSAVAVISPYVAKAYVAFVGTNGSVLGTAHNVASVTRNSTGNYSVVFSSSFADGNYVAVGSCTGPSQQAVVCLGTQSTSNINIFAVQNQGSGGPAYIDPGQVNLVIFGS